MGENNSNLFVQNSLKVYHSIKGQLTHTQYPTHLSRSKWSKLDLWSKWPRVIFLRVTSLPRNPYSARQLAKVSQTSLMRTKSTYFSVSPLLPCLPPFPLPLSSPSHLVFGYDPEVIAQTGPSPNAGLSTDVYPVTQLIAFFAHAAPLWLCEACPTHVFIPFCLLLLYDLGVFMHLGWITIFPKLLSIFPQLLSIGLLLI